MAAKRKASRKLKPLTPVQIAKMRKSFVQIVAAQRKVDLLIKKHRAMVSPMFYAI